MNRPTLTYVRTAADGQGSPAALRLLAARLIDAERDLVLDQAK